MQSWYNIQPTVCDLTISNDGLMYTKRLNYPIGLIPVSIDTVILRSIGARSAYIVCDVIVTYSRLDGSLCSQLHNGIILHSMCTVKTSVAVQN